MTDPTLPDPLPPGMWPQEPSDPWAGRAGLPEVPAVAGAPGPVVHTHIVYIERRRRRKWPWVVAIVLMPILGCCGVGAAVLAPITGQWPSHVAIGARPGGMVKDTSVVASLVAGQVAHEIKASLPVEGAFAAKLDDPREASRWVLLIGATRLILNPTKELDAAITQSTKAMQLTGVRSVDPGTMGGDMRCAKGRDDHDTVIAVCAWIDHGSEAVGLFYGKWSIDGAAAQFRAIREAVVTRG